MMGKHTQADREYNCHACGYKSCKDMATAIYRGLNTADNCIVHAKSVLVARHSQLAEQHEKLAEITSECLQLSEKLKADVADITSSMDTIGNASDATGKKAKVVDNLLENVISFCGSNQTMDEDSVSQLIEILKTTREAFSSLGDNVTATNKSSSIIRLSITEISKLVDNINSILTSAE